MDTTSPLAAADAGISRKLVRAFVAYLLAAIATTVLACLAQTTSVFLHLAALHVPASFSLWVPAALHDLAGLTIPSGGVPSYGLTISGALLIALPIGWFLASRLHLPVAVGTALAGGVAIMVLLKAISLSFYGLALIAAARTPGGLAGQALCGVAGGLLFGLIVSLPRR